MKLQGGDWVAEDRNDLAYWQVLWADRLQGGELRIHAIRTCRTDTEFRFVWWDGKKLGGVARNKEWDYFYSGLKHIYINVGFSKAIVVDKKSSLIEEGTLIGCETYHDGSFKIRVRFKWGWFHKDREYLG